MTREVVFETERLFACDWIMDDASGAFEIYRNPSVMRYMGDQPPVPDLATMQIKLQFLIDRNSRFSEGMGSFPVFEKASRLLVGNAMLKPLPDEKDVLTSDIEIGWHLNESSWGKGYATEFGQKLQQIGFEDLDLPRLHAVVDQKNQPSAKVATRLGMSFAGLTTAYYGGLEILHFVQSKSEYFLIKSQKKATRKSGPPSA